MGSRPAQDEQDEKDKQIELPEMDPVASARSAGLRYVSDAKPGISRRRRGKGFSYSGPDGESIRDAAVLERIRALAIPPAWTDVWICPSERGHLQASGRDERGRKQYRYHERWREVRDEAKFERMLAFGQALPGIHTATDSHLRLRGLPREKALAAVVRLLETTRIRVGNDEYAKQNDSYGLTTMQDEHVDINGSDITFRFRGKSGKEHEVSVRNRRLAKIVEQMQDLPGEELIQYVDDDGNVRDVTSDDVNGYLREITGQEFTAKDFRTWAGTVLASRALAEIGEFDSEVQGRKNVVQAVEAVAKRLGNTPTICRKCYIHPAVIDAYLDGTMAEAVQDEVRAELSKSLDSLTREEIFVLAFLQQRLSEDTGSNGA
jgi:DNA topoisomerase-1